MDNVKEIINLIYRKSANLNLYISICNVRKERVLKELADIKYNIEIVEDIVKKDSNYVITILNSTPHIPEVFCYITLIV